MLLGTRRASGKQGAPSGPFCFGLALASLAVVLPALWPFAQQPLLSLHTEALALLGWGIYLAWLAQRPLTLRWSQTAKPPALVAVAVLLLVLLANMLVGVLWRGWPAAIGLRHGVVLIAALTAMVAGARLAPTLSRHGFDGLGRGLLAAFVLAAMGSALVAALQYLRIDGPWQRLGLDGRAGGSLGQPNLLGTQLLWGVAALASLPLRRAAWRWAAWAAAMLMLTALAMSASRSGALATLLLAAWGLLDRRLCPHARRLLVSAPLILAVVWFGLELWQRQGGPGFAGTELMRKADVTSSRLGLWQQCLLLIEAQPWTGVGWGQFNFAWTLTPMPGLVRTAGYTFTHAHNIFLHWAVELGLPQALGLAGLLLFALLRSARVLWRPGSTSPVAQRAAWVIVAVVLLHSQFEFPLWHVHFLLPTCFLLGLCLAPPGAVLPAASRKPGSALLPLLMALAAAFAMLDYRALAAVYAPPPDGPPLEQRFEQARAAILFGHFGDRFAATTVAVDKRRLVDFRGSAFEVLDWRLMASWAQTLAAQGELEQARYVAARLKEFDSPGAQLFFAPCAEGADIAAAAFQCQAPRTGHGLDEFREFGRGAASGPQSAAP